MHRPPRRGPRPGRWSPVATGIAKTPHGALPLLTVPAALILHLYPAGASLYYTFMAAQQRGREIEQWRAAKTAASDAIVAAGGTITHHHAIGIDHAAWLRAEIGDAGIGLLRAAKEQLDPRGIMNPGKLLPTA